MGRLFAPKTKSEVPVVEPAKTESPSAGLSKDEVKELVTGAVAGVAGQLSETVAQLGAKVEALASRQPQVIVQPPVTSTAPTRITDEDIDQAVITGQGAASRIRALVDRAVNEATTRVIKEHIEPLQNFGVNTLGELSRRVTSSGMKYYDRYRKEIDDRLNALDPAVRVNPAVQEMVYNAVVGSHTEELTRESAESAIRKAQETGEEANTKTKGGSAIPGTGAGARGERDAEDVPTLHDMAGQEGVEALQHRAEAVRIRMRSLRTWVTRVGLNTLSSTTTS